MRRKVPSARCARRLPREVGAARQSAAKVAAMATAAATPGVGPLLRDWRRRRRLSQLDLALEAGVSARHLSFVETGRSRPSADMVLQLADQLEVPLRNRNQLLLAAGHAPVFEQHALEDPEMAPVRRAIDLILDGPRPLPGGRDRPRLGDARRQPRRGAPDRRGGARAARAAGQRPAPEPAPRRRRAADRQPGRVARAPARPPRAADRADRRPGAGQRCSTSCRPTRRRSATRGEPEIAVPLRLRSRARRAVVHQHGGHVRHRRRGDRQRALDRVVLPGGRADREAVRAYVAALA